MFDVADSGYAAHEMVAGLRMTSVADRRLKLLPPFLGNGSLRQNSNCVARAQQTLPL